MVLWISWSIVRLPVFAPPNAIGYGSGVVPITRMITTGISFDVIGGTLFIVLLRWIVGLVGIGR